jgi:hypothetical protein
MPAGLPSSAARTTGALLVLGTLAGCGGNLLGSTGVQVDLVTRDPTLRAATYELAWFNLDRRLFLLGVPEEAGGRLSEAQASALSIYIEIDPDRAGPRKVVARGLADDRKTVLSIAAARVPEVAVGAWPRIELVLQPAASLGDTDRDGLPDSIDECPNVNNLACRPGGDVPDGGIDGAVDDAGPAGDGSPGDRPGDDAAPDSGDGSSERPPGDGAVDRRG